MVNEIEVSKSLPHERWGKFFDQFSYSNSGRQIAIEIVHSELDDEVLIGNASLLTIIYDRSGRGNALVIEVSKDKRTYGHVIYSPTEVSTKQNSNGQMVALWISDVSGTKTLIELQASVKHS